MGLEFINSGFLWALSMAGVPILLHLLQRRRLRTVRWGAMEFLLLSVRNRARRLKLEQLILLLIRCLILVLVALALARPVLRPSETGLTALLAMAVVLGCLLALVVLVSLSTGAGARTAPIRRAGGAAITIVGLLAIFWLIGANRGAAMLEGDSRVHAVIILDDSFSMGYMPAAGDREALFDIAKQRALDLVERGLRNGDSVNLVLGGDPPRAVIRTPSFDLDAVAAEIRRAEVGDGATNYGRLARLCEDLLAESTNPNREVYLITDAQQNGWDAPGIPLEEEAWNRLAEQSQLTLLAVQDRNAENIAVTGVQAVPGLVTTRQSARLRAQVRNHTPRAATVSAQLEVDGRPAETLQAEVEPGERSLVVAAHRFERPGSHVVTVRLQGDRLERDDVAYFSVRVREQVRALILNGRFDPTSARDAAAFLVAAMAPDPDGTGSDLTALEPEVVAGNSFGGRDLSRYELIALCNVPNLSQGDREALAAFVQDGGGLLVFMGDQVSADFYNRELFGGTPELLPARLGELAGGPEDRVFIDPASIDHLALARFRGATDVDLDTAEFTRYFRLRPPEEDRSVHVMLRFTNGEPVMVERRLGQGRIVLVASGANTEWNDLPFKPAFIPLVHELSSFLAQGGEQARNVYVGEPLVKALPLSEANSEVIVVRPDGERENVLPVVDERGCTVTYTNTDRVGVYQMIVEGGETEETFCVNVDPRGADLAVLDASGLRQLLPDAGWVWVNQNEDMVAAVRRARLGLEMWPHLLYLALLLMLVETALAQAFGRRA